jgi:sulfur carrier protein
MKIVLNGEAIETECNTLTTLLESLKHDKKSIATAVNKEFVPVEQRDGYVIEDGDLIEVIAPMSGG